MVFNFFDIGLLFYFFYGILRNLVRLSTNFYKNDLYFQVVKLSKVLARLGLDKTRC